MFTAKKLHVTDFDTESEAKGYYVKLNKKHYIVKEDVEDAEFVDLEYCPGGYTRYLGIDLIDLHEIDPSTLKYTGDKN